MEGLMTCVSVFPYRDLSNLRSMSAYTYRRIHTHTNTRAHTSNAHAHARTNTHIIFANT
jgi:hypothetical protein